MLASLQGEDQDAYKYFLAQGNVKTAMTYCRTTKQQAYVSSIYANQLFKQGKFDRAAAHYIRSGLSFETVCMKFLQANQGIRMINYLQEVLAKLQKMSEAEAPPAKPNQRQPAKNAPKPKDRWSAQRLVICTWIAELMLSKIAVFKAKGVQKNTDAEIMEH